MELKQIGSMVDLINFFWERDANKNGMLEAGEFKGVDQYDKSGNHALLPWELMGAVNTVRGAEIFTPLTVEKTMIMNADGKTFFPFIDLKENALVQGLMFSSWDNGMMSGIFADIRFHDNGQISGGSLAVNTNIGGIIYKAGPKGGAYVINPGIKFYEDGQVESGMLASDATIDEITYDSEIKNGLFGSYTITFYKGGKVKSGVLSSDTTIDGITYKGGTWITFYENGRVNGGTPLNNLVKNGIKFKGGTDIEFYDNGNVLYGELAANKTIFGIALKAGTTLEFYESGHVTFILFEKNATFDGVTYLGSSSDGGEIGFYENGQVRDGILAHDTIIDGNKFAAGTVIRFYENGKISHGTLAETGQRIEFDEDGVSISTPPSHPVLLAPGEL